jgi:hypothetical protein
MVPIEWMPSKWWEWVDAIAALISVIVAIYQVTKFLRNSYLLFQIGFYRSIASTSISSFIKNFRKVMDMSRSEKLLIFFLADALGAMIVFSVILTISIVLLPAPFKFFIWLGPFSIVMRWAIEISSAFEIYKDPSRVIDRVVTRCENALSRLRATGYPLGEDYDLLLQATNQLKEASTEYRGSQSALGPEPMPASAKEKSGSGTLY